VIAARLRQRYAEMLAEHHHDIELLRILINSDEDEHTTGPKIDRLLFKIAHDSYRLRIDEPSVCLTATRDDESNYRVRDEHGRNIDTTDWYEKSSWSSGSGSALQDLVFEAAADTRSRGGFAECVARLRAHGYEGNGVRRVVVRLLDALASPVTLLSREFVARATPEQLASAMLELPKKEFGLVADGAATGEIKPWDSQEFRTLLSRLEQELRRLCATPEERKKAERTRSAMAVIVATSQERVDEQNAKRRPKRAKAARSRATANKAIRRRKTVRK